MNAGRVMQFLWTLAFWWFVLSVFVLPVVFTYWRHNEKRRAAETEKTLESLGYDTSGAHYEDAL